MLDISRTKVPTMDTLLTLIDQFSTLKYNQIQLYTEHTFAFSNQGWSKAKWQKDGATNDYSFPRQDQATGRQTSS